MGRAVHPQVAFTGWVEQAQDCWFRQTQSQRVVSNLCRLDTHLALGSGRHEQDRLLKTNPQPHCCTDGHLHPQVDWSNT